ncbi:hypothetical protein HanPSC8_Chr03g0088001 [Helianthus annuus]|nr:hypothetical protein HanPSC8_Chr03g0088001 [Helianthus annuus]
MEYSGSRYPNVPLRPVLTPEDGSSIIFDKPKSAIFAAQFSSSRILELFTSRCMIPCWVPTPVCR